MAINTRSVLPGCQLGWHRAHLQPRQQTCGAEKGGQGRGGRAQPQSPRSGAPGSGRCSRGTSRPQPNLGTAPELSRASRAPPVEAGPPVRAAGWYDGAFLLLLGVKCDQRLPPGSGRGRCEGSRSFRGLWVCGGSCARHTSAPPSPSSLHPPLSSQQTGPPAGAPQSLAWDVTEICTQKATQLTLCVSCLDFTRVNPYQTQPLPLGSRPRKLQP